MPPRFWPRSGADVVKIEPIRGGDPFRRGVDVGSPYFVQYNAGKRSLAVDLKKPDGIALVKTLLPKFDVLIENSRPGKMDVLGLGHADCIAINPRLIYSSASGFGDGGPYRDRAAYDSMGQSMGAYYSIMNNAGAPRLTGTCIADLITAIVGYDGYSRLARRPRAGPRAARDVDADLASRGNVHHHHRRDDPDDRDRSSTRPGNRVTHRRRISAC